MYTRRIQCEKWILSTEGGIIVLRQYLNIAQVILYFNWFGVYVRVCRGIQEYLCVSTISGNIVK